jgi:alpha-beta hydrolase superfamily lysophospholipase
LPIYLFSGSEDPVGQQLEGVELLIERYSNAGISDISYDFYLGGRHEMLNEINRREVLANLLHWMCGARNVRGTGFIAVTGYDNCIPEVELNPC